MPLSSSRCAPGASGSRSTGSGFCRHSKRSLRSTRPPSCRMGSAQGAQPGAALRDPVSGRSRAAETPVGVDEHGNAIYAPRGIIAPLAELTPPRNRTALKRRRETQIARPQRVQVRTSRPMTTVGLPGLWPMRKQRRRRIAALGTPCRGRGRSRTTSCSLDGLRLLLEDIQAAVMVSMVSSAGLCTSPSLWAARAASVRLETLSLR